MKTAGLLVAASLFVGAAPAIAQDSGGFMLGVTGGTLGIGPEATFRVNETIGIRANATFFNFSRNVDSSDVDYDGELKLSSGGAMVDLHPFGGGFRISAGARVGSNHVDLEATPTGIVEIGDEEYTPAEVGVLSGRVKAKDFAPALTLGWGGGLTRGLKFGFEAGALFQGAPKVSRLEASGTLANNPDFRAQLEQEAAEIENDIDKFKVYPIIQLSVGYRF